MNRLLALQAMLSFFVPHPGIIRALVKGLGISIDDVADYLREPRGPYGSKSVLRTPAVQMSVLNWATRSVCLPHDHGPAWALVYIIQGSAYHAIYGRNDEDIPVLQEESTVQEGESVFLSPGTVHAMGASDEGCVSLNIYGPALSQFVLYDLENHLAAIVGARASAGSWPSDPKQIVRLIRLAAGKPEIQDSPPLPQPCLDGGYCTPLELEGLS
jgi:quercetin dioxygenase-like cupin family protein